VLDDSANARKMTIRRLRSRGFETLDCVIIADWELSHDADKHGDKVLEAVRKRDWDVPFGLVSGKLEQDTERAGILEKLLESGSARFVKRGHGAIAEACESAEDLIERRDLALLKVILNLREGALRGVKIKTTTGEEAVSKLLESVVSRPKASHDAGRPVAKSRSSRALKNARKAG
jgi:hypothetical protein